MVLTLDMHGWVGNKLELEPYLILYTKFKKIIILNLKAKIIKFLQKYIEQNICTFQVGKVFSYKIQKSTNLLCANRKNKIKE